MFLIALLKLVMYSCSTKGLTSLVIGTEAEEWDGQRRRRLGLRWHRWGQRWQV